MTLLSKNIKEKTVNPELVDYVNKYILPLYSAFDKGHQQDHIQDVWKSCQQIIKDNGIVNVNINMMYVVAHYHDIGMTINRPEHHIYSGRLLKADKFINHMFSPADVDTMAIAVTDHRASNEHAPRNIYGEIVADGDRQLDDIDKTVKRFYFAMIIKNKDEYTSLSKEEFFDQLIYNRICQKYGSNGEHGYLTLNFKQSPAQKELDEIAIMAKANMYEIYSKQYDHDQLSAKTQ